jgi:hypothetical protein
MTLNVSLLKTNAINAFVVSKDKHELCHGGRGMAGVCLSTGKIQRYYESKSTTQSKEADRDPGKINGIRLRRNNDGCRMTTI